MLRASESGEKYKIALPEHKAAVLALEGHGLNDRCGLYFLLSQCMGELGASFGSVVVTLGRSNGVTGEISLVRDGDVRKLSADVVELVAFALHVSLPIYVELVDEEAGTTCTPAVFEDALTEIMRSRGADGSHQESPQERERGCGAD